MSSIPRRTHLRLGDRLIFAAATIAPALAAEPAAPASAAYGQPLELVADASVAEALARQRNLSFSSVKLDGEKSSLSLSALTADQILNAVATKVPTPDLDADAVGGLLQLTSRRAFDQAQRTLRGSAAIAIDPLIGEPAAETSLTFGRTLGTQKRLGFLATLTHRQTRDRDEEIELDWRGHAAEPRRFQTEEDERHEDETSINGVLDWNLAEKNVVFFRFEAVAAKERDWSRQLGYELRAVSAVLPPGGVLMQHARVRRSLEHARERSRGVTLAAGATYHSDAWLMDLRLTHQTAVDRVPEARNYEFEQSGVALLYRRAEAIFPTVTRAAETASDDARRQRLDELQVHRGSERETDAIASFDATRRMRHGGPGAWLKGGIKARLRRTTRDEQHEIYEPADGGVTIADVSRGPISHVLRRRYRHDGFPEFAALNRFVAAHPGKLFLSEAKTRSDTDPANFAVREHILAGYLMGNVQAGANRIVIGARAEHTASRFAGHEVAFDDRGRYEATRAVTAQRAVTHLFPGLHASRPLAKNLTAFASWTRSIRRPDYVDLVPARRISRADREIEEGNADLRPALYTNYDGALEFTYRNDGRLSLEIFHREIRDPSFVRRTLLPDGPFAGFERERPENGGRARVQGAQITWEQALAPLAKRLDGVELKVNYTAQRTRQSLENRPGEALALTGRPAHELAVEVSYDRGPYYVSVEFSRTSRTLDSVGRHPREDRFTPASHRWDVSFSRKFRQGLRLFVDIENLNATSERRYAGTPARPDRYSLDLRGYRLGMKWER